jgi:hypothetical protein
MSLVQQPHQSFRSSDVKRMNVTLGALAPVHQGALLGRELSLTIAAQSSIKPGRDFVTELGGLLAEFVR